MQTENLPRAICGHCSIVLPLRPGAPCPRCGVGRLAHPVEINGTPTNVAGLVVLVPPEPERTVLGTPVSVFYAALERVCSAPERCGCEESQALARELGRVRELMAQVLEDRAATAARLEAFADADRIGLAAALDLEDLADEVRAEIERARRAVWPCCPGGGS